MYFPTTHWSLLAQATLSGETAGRQALEELFRRYWSPLQQFIRARGYNETEAEDLRQEFEAVNDPKRFAVLGRFLPGSLDVPTYEEAAAQLGLTLPALKSELHRLRHRFRTLVRQEVASTVSAPHEIDEEMSYLQQVLLDKGNDLNFSQKPPPAVS